MSTLPKEEFLRLAYEEIEAARNEAGVSYNKLSEDIGMSPGFAASTISRRSEMGAYALYRILNRLQIDPDAIFKPDGRIRSVARPARTDLDTAIDILSLALKEARTQRIAHDPPSFEQLISQWRHCDRRLDNFGSRSLSYCDLYDPPAQDGSLSPINIGEQSLTALVLNGTDVAVLQKELSAAPQFVSAEAAANQRRVIETQNYLLVEKRLRQKLQRGPLLDIIYDQLNLFVVDETGREMILVYPKKYMDDRMIS